MQVRLLQGIAGIAFSHSPGDVIDVPDETAKRYIERAIAEPYAAPKIETAAKRTPGKRTATKRGDS